MSELLPGLRDREVRCHGRIAAIGESEAAQQFEVEVKLINWRLLCRSLSSHSLTNVP